MRTLLSRTLALMAVVLAPLLVLGQGYLPRDDALRHAAKAVSGLSWSEILILRPEIALDSNPGWHALLSALHRWFGLGTVDLVVFSVVALFVVFSLGPVLLLRRPEAWLLALTLMGVACQAEVGRLMLGRPFLLSSAIVPLVCLLWPRLEERWPWPVLALFAGCGVVSCWMHGSYYLLALPVAALLAAGRWRAGAALAGAFALGIAVGALLTGHPLAHLWQMLLHGYLSVGRPHPASLLVYEFRPFDGAPLAVASLIALLVWRSKRRADALLPWRDPVVILVVLCWALGYVAVRFWHDWSAPALLTLAALEIQDALEHRDQSRASAAPLLVIGAAALLLVSTRADVEQRWSDKRGRLFLSQENPTHRAWLPDPGGIAYSADMGVFYSLFFANPTGQWRYVLGFEAALMRDEDYAVYTAIMASQGLTESYLPWLRRMRPEDRLYVVSQSNQPPPVPGLAWFEPVFGIWAGRLPRTPDGGVAAPPALSVVPLLDRVPTSQGP